MKVGLLHPGRMGAAVGARLTSHGHTVLWYPHGRSAATHERALEAGLEPVDDLSELLAHVPIVLSICPAAVAEHVAELVSEYQYNGIYVDANAISPQRMRSIHELLTLTGSSVVDAVISGPPPNDTTGPRVYLAGAPIPVSEVQNLLARSSIDTHPLGDKIGSASALKMATASYLRTARLLTALAHALADHHNVAEVLTTEAYRLGVPMLADRAYLSTVAARAWRWIPELHEIADTMRDADLPASMAEVSADIYELLAPEKDNWSATPEAALQRLMESQREE
ncbi:NAD(P)-dependent oxidoreductase [Nocardia blacklockiae]|uniref:NAD(P)-dependent oxidoreductase n=1 Tax=Nocardia blacklockiae TaxID=480036 RepID=UPI0018961C64|nr:NAD(P)-binding domain-containing protein [Nocardia blacklockiae]MBF6176781.1 NAD(P)-dependent oxidoreductase [Nocardia blacklockiae]